MSRLSAACISGVEFNGHPVTHLISFYLHCFIAFRGQREGAQWAKAGSTPEWAASSSQGPTWPPCFALGLQLRTLHFSAPFQTDWAATSPHLVTSGSQTQWGNQHFSLTVISKIHPIICVIILPIMLSLLAQCDSGGHMEGRSEPMQLRPWQHSSLIWPACFGWWGKPEPPKANPQRDGENILTQHRKVSYLGIDSHSCEAIVQATTPLCCYLM